MLLKLFEAKKRRLSLWLIRAFQFGLIKNERNYFRGLWGKGTCPLCPHTHMDPPLYKIAINQTRCTFWIITYSIQFQVIFFIGILPFRSFIWFVLFSKGRQSFVYVSKWAVPFNWRDSAGYSTELSSTADDSTIVDTRLLDCLALISILCKTLSLPAESSEPGRFEYTFLCLSITNCGEV